MSWTREQLRHAGEFLHQGRTPAASVYDSIGSDFPLALAPGWLNLGLWEGDGTDPAEAPVAVRRLVETVADQDSGRGAPRSEVCVGARLRKSGMTCKGGGRSRNEEKTRRRGANSNSVFVELAHERLTLLG